VVQVVDITNPLSPTLTGVGATASNSSLFNFYGGGGDIAVSGDYVYTVKGNSDVLAVIDVSDKSAPTVVGTVTDASYLNSADVVQVSGDYAFVSAPSCLTSVNIATKSTPFVEGWVCDSAYLSNAGAMTLSGNYAYTMTWSNYTSILCSIDVSTPATPSLHDCSIDTEWAQQVTQVDRIVRSGNLIMPISDINGAIRGRGYITDPGNVAIDVTPSYGVLFSGGDVRGDADNSRFVAVSTAGAVSTWTVSSRNAISRLASQTYDAPTTFGTYDVAVAGNYAYVISEDSHCLTVVDISTLSAPTITGEFCDIFRMKAPLGVAVSGNYVHVASAGLVPDTWGGETGVVNVIDVTDPASPVQVEFYEPASSVEVFMSDVAISGNLAFAASGNYTRISAYDISNPTAVVQLRSLSDGTYLTGTKNFGVYGNYLYVVSNSGDALSVIDITDPATSFVIEGAVQDATWLNGANGVAADGSYAYVAASSCGCLTVVDVSNPAAPVVFGHVQSGELSGAFDVVLNGNLAYVSSPNSSAITEVDITNKAAPVVTNTLSSTVDFYAARKIAHQNIAGTDYVFATGGNPSVNTTNNNRLTIVEVSAAPSSGPCTTTAAMRYNATDDVMEYCDGASWRDMGARGSGGAGCASPAASAGAMNYETTSNVYQFCDGTSWITID
jgi:hypothetical protein